MEFKHLRAFLSIADELHFGRAAAKLHLTQPSLSQQLRQLERTLGVELVARTSHEVGLTRAGRAFEVEARAIVAQVDKARRSAHDAAAGRSGTVHVGYNFPAGQHILPATVRRMHAEYPDVTVLLAEKRTGPQLDALADGELDVALVYGRPVRPEFRHRRLLRVPLVAVVGDGHRWAGRPGVPFAELAQEPCVLFRRELSPAMYDAIVSGAAAAGIRLNIACELDDPGATEIMVAVRPLVGFTSASRAMLAGSVLGGTRTVPVPLFDPVPALDLYAAWCEPARNPLRDTFLRCLDEAGPFTVPTRAPVPAAL